MIYISRGRGGISLVWALGKNTSPGREAGVNPKLLYFVITYAFAYSSDAGTPKPIIVTQAVTVTWLNMWGNGSGTLNYQVKGQMGINHIQKSNPGHKNFPKKSTVPKLGVISWAL